MSKDQPAAISSNYRKLALLAIFAAAVYAHARRKSDAQKQGSEALLRANVERAAVFSALPDMFLRIDRHDRVVDYEVGQEMRLFAPPERMLHARVEELLPPAAAAAIAGAIARARKSRQLVSVEYTLPFPDGERVCESRFIPFLDDQIIGIVRDVTERAQLLSDLSQARELAERDAAQLDATFQAMAEAVIIFDSAGGILRSNPAADRMFGYSPEQRRLNIDERLRLLAMEDAEGKLLPVEMAPPRRALRGETVVGITIVIHPPTGKTVWISASAAPIRDASGQVSGAIATYTDVTPLHELQERLRDVIRSLSHDLRNPLTSVLGQSQITEIMLEKAGGDPSVLDRVRSVVAAAKRMNEMLTQLTEATRIESGQLPVNPQPLDLTRLLSDYLARSAHPAEAGRVTLEMPSNLPLVLADSIHVDRIVSNLLSNALKYSHPSTDVVVKAEVTDGFVKISITDRGPGIPASEIPRLFDRFYRSKETAQAEGLGIGLYITKALVEAQGGTLSVASAIGVGSTFSFTLPAT